MTIGDTIVALSSVGILALRAVVRCSGSESLNIAQSLCSDLDISASVATRSRLTIPGLDLPVWVYLFLAPKSYTGESIAEFHIPGNPLVVKRVIAECLKQGARSAEPGEFTARAYFNGRLNLTEAEGVAATIAARNTEELHAARRLLAGELAQRLQSPIDLLAQTLALIEVGIDFSDEDVTFISAPDATLRIQEIELEINDLLSNSSRLEDLAHEPMVVLIGYPNAGKSTLLNALAGYERAVVSPTAGTTRDALSAHVVLDRGLIRMVDVAGLETIEAGRVLAGVSRTEAPLTVQREIDLQMQTRAIRAMELADLIVLVHAADDARPAVELPRTPDVVVRSKNDLLDASTPFSKGLSPHKVEPAEASQGAIAISVHRGDGINNLLSRLDELAFGNRGESRLALNARHLSNLNETLVALARARLELPAFGPEVVALHLREALDALGRVGGDISPDDVLGRVFSTFCIGK